MLTVLADKARYVKFLVNENSTTLLTGVGVAGTATTAYLTGRASFKAAQIIELERNTIEENNKELDNGHVDGIYDLTLLSKIKTTWRLYIPPFLMGAVTVTSIIAANKIASKKIAALAIAAGISDRTLQEYKQKVVEKWGDSKARGIHDEIAQDRVDKNPVGNEVIVTGTGEVLCYDMNTGRYFMSTVEDIKRAENKINYELIHFGSCSLTEFYDEIGLPATSYSDNVGWNINHHMEVKFSTTMSSDQRPCIAIDFTNPPIPDYHKNTYDG